jgi:hypothetical protein
MFCGQSLAATKPMLAEMLGTDGKPKVCERVWISSIGSAAAEQTGKLTARFGASGKIGPEFTFGIYMEKLTDAPILLIKTAWGGKSLNTDFRSPSGEPYAFKSSPIRHIRPSRRNAQRPAEVDGADAESAAPQVLHCVGIDFCKCHATRRASTASQQSAVRNSQHQQVALARTERSAEVLPSRRRHKKMHSYSNDHRAFIPTF